MPLCPCTAAWHRWVWNAISCAVYPYIFHQLWHMYSAGIREAREDAQTSLRMLRNVTVIFWTAFPVVWVLVQVGLLDREASSLSSLWRAENALLYLLGAHQAARMPLSWSFLPGPRSTSATRAWKELDGTPFSPLLRLAFCQSGRAF